MTRMTSIENRSNVKVPERKSSIKSSKDLDTSDSKSKRDRLKPLRILIVEPRGKYCRAVWCAVGVGVSHLMIGAIVMTTLMYATKTGDSHIGVCTIAVNPGGQYWNVIFCHFLVGIIQLFIGGTVAIILLYSIKTNFTDSHIILLTLGYHFFSAEAILSLNYANGWSSPMRLRHRRFAHVFLQMCALACAITGTALVMIDKGVSTSVHGITGILTTALAGITFLSGPCALFGGRYLKILHMSVGMPTFLVSSICLCFGAFASAFRSWAGDSVIYILTVFVIFYTSFIVITCFMKCVMRV